MQRTGSDWIEIRYYETPLAHMEKIVDIFKAHLIQFMGGISIYVQPETQKVLLVIPSDCPEALFDSLSKTIPLTQVSRSE